MHTKGGYVYLLTNRTNAVIYAGATSDLQKRIYEHKQGLIKGFTSRYNVNKLVYYEVFDDIESAISREKQIKSGSREKKIGLIERTNPGYRDLYPEL